MAAGADPNEADSKTAPPTTAKTKTSCNHPA